MAHVVFQGRGGERERAGEGIRSGGNFVSTKPRRAETNAGARSSPRLNLFTKDPFNELQSGPRRCVGLPGLGALTRGSQRDHAGRSSAGEGEKCSG